MNYFFFLLEGALSSPHLPSYIFLSKLVLAQKGEIKLLQQLTFKAAVCSILPLVSVTTSAWDFFFVGAN